MKMKRVFSPVEVTPAQTTTEAGFSLLNISLSECHSYSLHKSGPFEEEGPQDRNLRAIPQILQKKLCSLQSLGLCGLKQ